MEQRIIHLMELRNKWRHILKTMVLHIKFLGAVSIVWVDSVSREVCEQKSLEIKIFAVL